MNNKMTRNSELSTREPKIKNKSKLSKQLEQEQNHRNGDHMEGYWWRGEVGRMGGKVQRRSINGRYEIHRGRLGLVQETEKPKNLHVRPRDMN